MADTRWKVVAEKVLELLQLPAWSSTSVEQAHGSASAIRRCHPNEKPHFKSFLAPPASSALAPPASRSGSKRSDDKQMTEQDKKIEESSEPDADPEMPALVE